MNDLTQFLTATILSFCLLAAILPMLQSQFLDLPNFRSSHAVPTPRGGGLAFVLVGTLMTYLFAPENHRLIPVFCLPLAFAGLVDDVRNVPALWRYITQLLTAIGLVSVTGLSLTFAERVLLVVVITAVINFINFMDGIDGLVAGCGVLMLAGVSSWSLAGALLGFLFWNWSPAKVFMGDVGSTFIGGVFSGLIIQETSFLSFLQLFLLAYPLFMDAATCVIRRLAYGRNIFSAHRQHLFQRLVQAGWSHRKVSLLYIAGSLLLLIAKESGGIIAMSICIVFESAVAIYLDRRIAIKFESA